MTDMEARINKDLVAFAVGRQITCPVCRKVLDVSTSKLVESVKTTVVCNTCWKQLRGTITLAVEVTDGRTGTVSKHEPVSWAEPEKSEARIDGEQGDLF